MKKERQKPAVHQKNNFRLAATGDAILTREILPYAGQSDRFDSILEILNDADAALTNLEVNIHDYEPAPSANSGGTYMRAPPKVLDELDSLGFNLLSAATNHSHDYGQEGIERTLAELEHRDLTFAGIGETLYEARRPRYLETPAGRIGLVSVCTSMPPGSRAGKQTPTMRGRPGISPLRVTKVYQIHQSYHSNLQEISEASGIEQMKESWLERGLYYNHDWDNDDYFHLADEKFRFVEDESEQGVSYQINQSDAKALEEQIHEANANADWTIVTIHTHQGTGGRQNTQETPDFLISVAHDIVDAGANTVVCHGPHVLRGIEVYQDSPIFYSLGNFIVQNETVSRLPHESYQRYDLTDTTRVSQVFDARLFDENNNSKGDLANDAFWETIIPVCEFDISGKITRIELYPCTLQPEQARPQRGIPVLATSERGQKMIEDVQDLSEQFDTTVQLKNEAATIEL